MRCTSPIRAGFDQLGDITYSSKKMSQELASFEFECRKCLPCRLNIAREKAVRCYHEAQCHEDNIFLTLTYDDENLKSSKLIYKDWQDFIKRLRERITRDVTTKEVRDTLYTPYMVTGEYGEINKRPHWHAIIFNYRPKDAKHKYTTDHGELVHESEEINKLWGKGIAEFGTVTMDSASYVARYAAKKLVHGKDQDHDFHPIHKTSCKRAIGRSWIEKHWKHAFGNGFVVLNNGEKTKIPRYYVDWLKKTNLEEYFKYVNGPQKRTIELAEKTQRKEELEHLANIMTYKGDAPYPLTRPRVKETCLNAKFKRLQEELKL